MAEQIGHLIFDGDGALVGTHLWGGNGPQHCPLSAPPGGRVVRVRDHQVMLGIQEDHAAGRQGALTIRGHQIFRGEAPLANVEEDRDP